VLLASVMECAVRGPLRLLREGTGWNDFLAPYIQATAWTHGEDPYSTKSLIAFWPSDVSRPPFVDSEAEAGRLEMKRGIPSPYPLPSLVLISLFAALPWQIALSLWSAISVVAVIAAALALLAICGCPLVKLRSQIFLAAVFALAPLHTGLATANPAVLAIALCVGAVWASHERRAKTAGILLALAICLKPTVAAGFLLYYLLRRDWTLVITTCAAAATIGVAGVARLAVAGTPWISSYLENSRRMFATGSVDDFARTVGVRFNMINSQVFFGGLFSNPSTVRLLSQLLGIGLLVCWIWLCYRRRGSTGLLEISAISILSLIAVYHRFYDATLLILPLAWNLLLVSKRSSQVIVLAAIAPFFVPGPIVLTGLASSGYVPAAITNQWWWDAIILPHEAWDLILLSVLLLYFLWRETPKRLPPRAF
jgi:glycosyl transferase family 87